MTDYGIFGGEIRTTGAAATFVAQAEENARIVAAQDAKFAATAAASTRWVPGHLVYQSADPTDARWVEGHFLDEAPAAGELVAPVVELPTVETSSPASPPTVVRAADSAAPTPTVVRAPLPHVDAAPVIPVSNYRLIARELAATRSRVIRFSDTVKRNFGSNFHAAASHVIRWR